MNLLHNERSNNALENMNKREMEGDDEVFKRTTQKSVIRKNCCDNGFGNRNGYS